MLSCLLRNKAHPMVGDVRVLDRVDAELLACALFWGTDRHYSPSEIDGLFGKLPNWVHEQAERVGVNDPMIQSVIVDYVATGEVAW